MSLAGWLRRLALTACLLVGAACKHDHGDAEGHDHGPGPGAHAAGDAEEPEPLAITRWTERHELFVEFPGPLPGKPVPYHAHVTRLDGFQAVTEGTFHVRFRTPSGVVAETRIQGVKRPGIFVPEGPAPAAGTYTLEMAYEHEGKTDVFDCGSITVADPPPAQPDEAAGAITFLKEQQWKVPFATAWAEERALAKEIELPATVEPAAGDQLTIAAPTGGRFFHDPKLALAEGQRVEKGAVLGAIAPTVAGDDYSRLQLAADEARLAKQTAEREIARIEPLVKEGLLPERRLLEAHSELDMQSARLRSAQGRLARVVAPAGAGGLALRSTQAGVISQVLVANGEPVEPGAPIVRLGGTARLWLRARFVSRPEAPLQGAVPVAVRLPNGDRVELTSPAARFLSPSPSLDPVSRVATWIADVEGAPAGLRAGAQVVLIVRAGERRPVVAVPRGAVLDINTRPVVFVQTDGEHFDKRAVTLGDADGPFVEIATGVAKGDRVVARGGFDIHLSSLMGTVESHRH